jgi:F420H(2)-dependent quinone reductase
VTAAKGNQAVEQAAEPVKLPPRPLIRVFWMIHRALVRLSGGRIGLRRPMQGATFGMLRLQTVGRRSGQKRSAMIGYFEDGSNLVTLAMNGWGQAEPAWWLNLQANPEATVEAPDGRRVVRARAATGGERDRLWAAFREYPGWGDDLGALTARRPGETAIVVLEPATEVAR